MSNDPKPTSAPQKVRVAPDNCPICGKPVEARYRPFCSKRCADVDLNRWFGENYRVAAVNVSEEEALEALQAQMKGQDGDGEPPVR